MSTKTENKLTNSEARGSFVRHLLDDVDALQLMLDQGLIESGITRIGAEQEFCLLNENWRPSKKSQEILEAINMPHFTTELARYNLEINLDPLELKGSCFREAQNSLKNFLQTAKEKARMFDNKVLLTGILPTITKKELELDFMTPVPRYFAMNESIKAHRGDDFELRLRGVDELSIIHNSVLFEACNTSFQTHLQISPEDFISSYNWSLAITAPVLAISSNSPLLLGRELWSETRIALFQQSIDTRNSSYALQDQMARVNFGKEWASDSIVNMFKNDISNHKVLLSPILKTNSLEDLRGGRIPKLEALCLNNSTIFRWNRPCYGIGGGKAHVRIENRYIPAGPTVEDQMANFAFWVGLMKGRPKKYDNMNSQMNFRDAKSNFIKAARTGNESIMIWDNKEISSRELILNVMLPIAETGLRKEGISEEDINYYLGIIKNRTLGLNGSQWKVKNYRNLRRHLKQDDALVALTAGIYERQQADKPVHLWDDISIDQDWNGKASRVGHIMSTQVFTVSENDHADLATSIMEWKGIHHVPVEDGKGHLVGLLTWTHMKRQKAKSSNTESELVSEIMTRDAITVLPETKIEDAIRIMKKNEFGCLPVSRDEHLVGIITINDVLPYDKD